MKTVYCKNFPFKGYKAITIYPFLFVRKDCRHKMVPSSWRHEQTHAAQQKEMLILGFYLWYGIEYLVHLIRKRNHAAAYRRISFEREAYTNQYDKDYNAARPHFAWFEYL